MNGPLNKLVNSLSTSQEDEKETEDDKYHSKEVLRGSYGMDEEEYRNNYQRRKMSELKYVQRKNSEDILDFKGKLESYPEKDPPEYNGHEVGKSSKELNGYANPGYRNSVVMTIDGVETEVTRF